VDLALPRLTWWAELVRVLVVNAGSSSLKLRLLDGTGQDGDDAVTHTADLPAGEAGVDTAELTATLAAWPAPDVVGHRVVHGGTRFTAPVLVDAEVRAALAELTALAPLHQPKSLAALDAVTTALTRSPRAGSARTGSGHPGPPAVACFDTAFHTTLPPAAATYPIPREWRDRYAIRRYGFHGLSHAYSARRAAAMLGRPAAGLRLVTCHLGAGASLAAVRDGRSVDTTMGFTPLEGLVMATRSGTVDPGLLLWLIEQQRLTPHEVATALEWHSGLTALAGTGDMRAVQAAAGRGEPDAVLALEVYVHRLAGAVGAMTVAAGGLDALVFTGGVGERSAPVRGLAAQRLAHLGVAVDPARNAAAGAATGPADADISAPAAGVPTLVIAAREDLQIAAEARALLSRPG
jgi:acetate kinase